MEKRVEVQNRVTANPFSSERHLFYFQHTLRAAEIYSVLNRAECADFQGEENRHFVFSPCLHEGQERYQLTLFRGDDPWWATHTNNLRELADSLAGEMIRCVDFIQREGAIPVRFIDSKYISPNGTTMTDGLDAIGDAWSLEYARMALVTAGFAQIQGGPQERTITVNDKRYMSDGQREALQEAIYESLKAGSDVTIQTLSGEATTLVEENTYNIAQIHGWLVGHDGMFAHGEYETERERTIEEVVSRGSQSGRERKQTEYER